jgi:short-subunit dehydrogenase
MKQRGRGTIVNVASLSALIGTPMLADYTVSKAAIASYSEVLRVELARHKVEVLTVYPGPVSTPMEEAGRDALGRGGMADLIPSGSTSGLAKAIERAITKRRPRLVYPRLHQFAARFPHASQWFMTRFAPA